MAEGIEQQKYFDSVKQFNCPNCGGSLEVVNARTRYITCHYCGSELDPTGEQAEMLGQLHDPGQHAPMTFVKLGMEMELNGLHYHVVGRTRWKMDYQERWYEDGEVGYSHETWTYDEWLMLSEEKSMFYLVEDSEGFRISRPVIPTTPSITTDPHKRLNFLGGRPQPIAEIGDKFVEYHEGESTYQIRKNEQAYFCAYKERSSLFSAQWRTDEDGNRREIEFWEDIPISKKKVAEAFGLEWSQVQAEYGSAVAGMGSFSSPYRDKETLASKITKSKNYRFLGLAMAVGGIVMLGLWIWSGFVDKEIVRFEKDYKFGVFDRDSTRLIGTQAFEITEEQIGKPLQVGFRSTLSPDNSWIYVGVEVVDADSIPVQAMEGDFWRESGSTYECDDGGCGTYHWSESNLSNSFLFKPQTTGQYRIRVFAIPGEPIQGKIKLWVEETVLSRYYGIMFFILLIPGGIIFFLHKNRLKIYNYYYNRM